LFSELFGDLRDRRMEIDDDSDFQKFFEQYLIDMYETQDPYVSRYTETYDNDYLEKLERKDSENNNLLTEKEKEKGKKERLAKLKKSIPFGRVKGELVNLGYRSDDEMKR